MSIQENERPADRACAECGCIKGRLVRDRCVSCLEKLKRRGVLTNLGDGRRWRGSPEQRFERLVQRSPDGCHLWRGDRIVDGYGRFRLDGGLVLAHRAAWMFVNGAIPDGVEICHTCDVPACVRVEHLFLGTHLENMADMARKGRQRGARKLTPEIVRDIRQRVARGEHQEAVGLLYNIGQGHVGQIVRRTIWKHVT